MKKFTIEDVKKYIFENDKNKDCTLLSDAYINSKTKMLFICNCCGKEFKRTFSDVKRNEFFKCAVCAQGRKLSIQDVKEFIKNNDLMNECELLSNKYENYYAFLKLKCNHCGKIFERKFSQIKEKNFACYDCLKSRQGGHNKLSIDIVKTFIKENDLQNNCTLISHVYINQYQPLLFICNCCGKEFERTFATLRSKKSFKCFRCAHRISPDSSSKRYQEMVSYFRGKTYLWKKDFLEKHKVCDITKSSKNLEIHHLINFSTILSQASLNSGVPLEYPLHELEQYGYSLEALTKEFIKLHNNAKAVLLTKECHQLFHKLYGYTDNTPEQYFEFKKLYEEGEIILS